MKKTFLIALLVMMISLAISVVSFAEEEITLRFSWWGTQNRHDRTLAVIKLFEEKYPNVKIEPEFVGYSEYHLRFATQAAAKNIADIFQTEAFVLVQGPDLFLNLDPYVEDNRLDLTYATEGEIYEGKYNGKLYSVNNGSNDFGWVWDPELFKKAGVEEPTPDWTWEDYIEKARKIHNALGIYADDVFDGVSGTHGFLIWLRQHGQALFDEKSGGKKLGYDDDSFFVDFYSMFIDLMKEGVIAPAEVSLEIGKNLENFLITRQEAAMTPILSNQIVAITAAAGRPLNMTIWPNSKNQVKGGNYVRASQQFAVANNTKYPEWAVKFLDFIINDLEANKILLAERGVPISSKLREELKPFLGDPQKKMFDFIDAAVKYGSPRTELWSEVTKLAEITESINEIYAKMIYYELTPEEAAKEFREEANKILASE